MNLIDVSKQWYLGAEHLCLAQLPPLVSVASSQTPVRIKANKSKGCYVETPFCSVKSDARLQIFVTSFASQVA